MTININELRQLAQAALTGPDGVSLNWVKLLQDFQKEANPATVIELMDRLEAAEKELESWKGLAKQFGNEADACATHLYFAKDELNRLRARIEAMEKQEPVARTMGEIRDWVSNGDGTYSLGGCLDAFMPLPDETSLYALPGAQQCKNCNGMGDRFDPSGEKIPCDLCESNLEEIRVLVAEAAHDIVSGSDFWLSTSLAAKKIYALPGAKGEGK